MGFCGQKEAGVCELHPQASFLLPPISSGERVGVQVQGCVQTEGLQVFPLSQEARQVCPLTGPQDPN